MRWWMMVCVLVVAASPLSAQVVSGRVSDTRGRPVRFAAVTVLNAEGMAVGHAQTDASGIYTATVGSAGRFQVRARMKPSSAPALFVARRTLCVESKG